MSAKALAERVGIDEGFESGDQARMPSASELGLYTVFHAGEAYFLEASDLRRRPRLVGKLRERRAAPEAKRLLEEHCRFRRMPGGKLHAAFVDKALERA